MTGLALWTVAAHALLKINTMPSTTVFLLFYYSGLTWGWKANFIMMLFVNFYFSSSHFIYLFMHIFHSILFVSVKFKLHYIIFDIYEEFCGNLTFHILKWTICCYFVPISKWCIIKLISFIVPTAYKTAIQLSIVTLTYKYFTKSVNSENPRKKKRK